MFEILNDYSFNGEFNENHPQILLMKKQEKDAIKKLGKCSCRWTCSFWKDHHSNCEETVDGCGFLWIQSCTGAVF